MEAETVTSFFRLTVPDVSASDAVFLFCDVLPCFASSLLFSSLPTQVGANHRPCASDHGVSSAKPCRSTLCLCGSQQRLSISFPCFSYASRITASPLRNHAMPSRCSAPQRRLVSIRCHANAILYFTRPSQRKALPRRRTAFRCLSLTTPFRICAFRFLGCSIHFRRYAL